MTKLQRYDIYHDHPSCGYECCGGGRVEIDLDDAGEWVKWGDVVTELEALLRTTQPTKTGLSHD